MERVRERHHARGAGRGAGREARDVLPRQFDAPPAGDVDAGYHIEERRLAGAVRADDCKYLALVHGEADAVDRLDRAERYPDILDREDHRVLAISFRAIGTMPSR